MLSHANDAKKERDQTVCNFCDKKYSTIGNCRRHMVVCFHNKKNAPEHSLEVIENEFVEPPLISSNESLEINKNHFPCSTCYKSYSRSSYLKEHTPNCKHISSARECSTCHKTYASKSSLYVHRKSCVLPPQVPALPALPTLSALPSLPVIHRIMGHDILMKALHKEYYKTS